MADELSRVLELVTNLCSQVREDLRKYKNPTSLPQGVMPYWFVKAAKTYDAVLLLWREGYWQDAAALTRTILEVVFQSKYLSKDPEPRAKLFMIHDQRDRLKMLKKADEYNDPSDTDIADFIKSLEPAAIALEKWRNWWGKDKGIFQLTGSIELKEPYDSAYRLLSVLIHSAPPGTSFYLFGTDDTVKVDWKANPPAPEKKGMAETFIASASAYMMDIIQTVGAIYGFDYSADLQMAVEAIRKFREI